MIQRSMRAVAGATVLAACCAGLGIPRAARGSGFALNEHSTRLMGVSYAGTAAAAEDASTGFYNPAGLTRIKYGNIVGVGTGYIISATLDATSASTLPAPFTVPVTGGQGSLEANPAVDAGSSAFHVAQRLADDWVFGFGITAPFGLETNYGQWSVARFIATKSRLVTVNLNPNIAWQITDTLSIGAGFDIQYLYTELNQEVPIGVPPLLGEGSTKITADDWSFGGNAGILYEPLDGTRIGLAYRSQVQYNLTGEVQANGIPFACSSYVQCTGNAEASLTVPESVTLGAVHSITPHVQVLFDLAWTHWSRFNEIRGTFPPDPSTGFNGLPDDTVLENFRDTWRACLGAQYFFNDKWTARAGFGFDQSPVHDTNRTARLPDANRWLLSFGGGYYVTDRIAVDLGYLHVFIEDGTIDETAQTPDKSNLQGEYSGLSANLIGAQITYSFDQWWPIQLM